MRAAGALLAAALLAGACGTDDDSCPTNDCFVLQARTVVKWTFNRYIERGFLMDSCVDFGATKVAVDVVDGAGAVTSLQEDCGVAQATFSGLAPGDYQVFVMPLDAAGNPLLSLPAQGAVTAGETSTEVTVNVPWDAWLGTHTGTFLFRLSWAGVSCELATPAIAEQAVTLTVNGLVQSVVTDDGQRLDGTDRKPCKRLSDNFPQSALGVPFGPATLLVVGYDATSTLTFQKQFDTFVGAGITNPTLTFDVPLQ